MLRIPLTIERYRIVLYHLRKRVLSNYNVQRIRRMFQRKHISPSKEELNKRSTMFIVNSDQKHFFKRYYPTHRHLY